jgi:hypothetical protein
MSHQHLAATFQPNGNPVRALRFAIFGTSVVSDYGNPLATTVRAIMRALMARGHEVTFLEERRNQPTLALLRDRGAAPLRAFATHAPDLRYRTYQLLAGAELTLWLSRELATVDAVILLEGTPPPICALLSGRPARHLVRIAQMTAQGTLLPDPDLVIAPVGSNSDRLAVPFGPAVLPVPDPAANRAGVVLVSYDDDHAAVYARAALSQETVPLTLAAAGLAHPPNWPFVPEVEIQAHYRASRLAVVIGAGASPYAAARALLPLAAGCQVVAVGEIAAIPQLHGVITSVAPARLAEAVSALLAADPPVATVPAAFDANLQAERLVSATMHRLEMLSFDTSA